MMLNKATDQLCTAEDDRFLLIVILIVGGWASSITCVIGLFANTFSIIVLGHRTMRVQSTNVYLMALASVNALWLIFFFIFYAFRFTLTVPHKVWTDHPEVYSAYDQFFVRSSPYVSPLMNTLQYCIIYYTVAVSIDRFLHVSMGLNTNHYCTARNSIRVIILITIAACLFIGPHWFQYHVVGQMTEDNRTAYRMEFTQMGEQYLFRQIVNIYLYIPIVHVIPFVTLIIINLFTARLLHQYHRKHHRLLAMTIRSSMMIKSNAIYSRRHYHTTIMLIAVVVLFLVCRSPMLINQIFEVRYSIGDQAALKDHLYFRCRIQRTFRTWATFLQTINANGNLIIYLLCCQNFRKISKDLIKRFLIPRRKPQTNEYMLRDLNQQSRRNTRLTGTVE